MPRLSVLEIAQALEDVVKTQEIRLKLEGGEMLYILLDHPLSFVLKGSEAPAKVADNNRATAQIYQALSAMIEEQAKHAPESQQVTISATEEATQAGEDAPFSPLPTEP